MAKSEKSKVSQEVAIKEFKEFVEKYSYETKEDWEIKDEYPMAIKAIEEGLLVFDKDLKPVYSLKFPMSSEKGGFNQDKIEFRTRIKPVDLSNISRGLNIQKQQQEYALRCISYIVGLSVNEVNLLEKFDYKVLEQVSMVFL